MVIIKKQKNNQRLQENKKSGNRVFNEQLGLEEGTFTINGKDRATDYPCDI
jgi:hypothetical protein